MSATFRPPGIVPMPQSLEQTPDHRRRVAVLLTLLASEDNQRVLARRTGRERVAFELARAWFDDVYVPSGRYVGGLKGDYSPEAAEQFRDAFDPVELAAMERFHRFFELRMNMIAASLIEECIPIDERWRSLMRDAGYLVEDLGIDIEALRLRLRIHDEGSRPPAGISDLIRIEG